MQRANEYHPALVAHRGLTEGGLIENTVESISAAIEAGLAAVEFDVRRTGDGAWIVHHDATLERIHGIDRAISHLSLEELQELAPVAALEDVVVFFADAIDDHAHGAADELPVLALADALLKGHQGVAPLNFHGVGDLAVHHTCTRVLFDGVGEDTDAVELDLFDPVVEFLEVGVGLARKACDEGRAEHEVRDFAETADEVRLPIALDVAPHRREDGRRDVLAALAAPTSKGCMRQNVWFTFRSATIYMMAFRPVRPVDSGWRSECKPKAYIMRPCTA